MFDRMKPGHVIKFTGQDPSTIGPRQGNTTNTKARTEWPGDKTPMVVELTSHPSGSIAPIASEVALHLRSGISLGRVASYSPIGRANTVTDRVMGTVQCGYTGYGQGFSYYVEYEGAVISQEFSGCLLAAYLENNKRRVAHVFASQSNGSDCKHDFLRGLLEDDGTELIGWFRPWVEEMEGPENEKIGNWLMKKGYINGHHKHIRFGVISANNTGHAFSAFKPHGIAGQSWVITQVKSVPLQKRYQFS